MDPYTDFRENARFDKVVMNSKITKWSGMFNFHWRPRD